MPRKVWFNRTFSSIYNLLRLIREADTEKMFHTFCTHDAPDFIGFEAADSFAVEPAFARGSMTEAEHDAAYVDYCLSVCRERGVTLFQPWKKIRAIACAQKAFAAAGVTLLGCVDPQTLDTLNHKGAFYQSLRDSGLTLPEYRLVNTPEAFAEAVRELRLILGPDKKLCYKPAQSIYGQGFHRLRINAPSPENFPAGSISNPLPDPFSDADGSVHWDELQPRLAGVERFRDMLVMEYLDGHEYSVDCLAREGRLIRATVRKKPNWSGSCQLLEDNPRLIEMAEHLTRAFNLSGIYNVQARMGGGLPKLLEINPRMAGGLHYSCLGGVNYPYWMLRLAADPAAESLIPETTCGLQVRQAYLPFISNLPNISSPPIGSA